MRFALGVLMVLTLVGCAEPEDHPNVDLVAPHLDPPPPESKRLSREGVVGIATKADDPADAIAILDTRPFEFELDAQALKWFGNKGLSPQVLDYLEKRSKVDWDSLRGDIDPSGPVR